MSVEGIKIAAKALEALQDCRTDLIRLSTVKPATKACQQDLLLAQLLAYAKDSVKERFALITCENTKER